MEECREIGILGSGGQADEAESYTSRVVGFRALNEQYVDTENPAHVNILTPNDYQKITPVIAAIGAPEIRRKMVEDWPGEEFATIREETAYVDNTAEIGDGVIIAPRAVITTNVKIGEHSIINVAATISHNTELGAYSTVGPGAHIAGNVKIGAGVFIGIGAVISNNLEIADGVVIGAGAVVVDNIIEPNAVLVGTPARIVKINEEWLREV